MTQVKPSAGAKLSVQQPDGSFKEMSVGYVVIQYDYTDFDDPALDEKWPDINKALTDASFTIKHTMTPAELRKWNDWLAGRPRRRWFTPLIRALKWAAYVAAGIILLAGLYASLSLAALALDVSLKPGPR